MPSRYRMRSTGDRACTMLSAYRAPGMPCGVGGVGGTLPGRGQQVVEHEGAQVVAVRDAAERPQPPGLRLAHAFQQPARLAGVAEVLYPLEPAEPLPQRVVEAVTEQVVVVAGDAV